jgi:hypothetical protein
MSSEIKAIHVASFLRLSAHYIDGARTGETCHGKSRGIETPLRCMTIGCVADPVYRSWEASRCLTRYATTSSNVIRRA